MSAEELEQLHQEIELSRTMSEDKHPSIVTLLDAFEE